MKRLKNYLRGIGSVLNIFPSSHYKKYEEASFCRSEDEAFSQDARKLALDFDIAYKKVISNEK